MDIIDEANARADLFRETALRALAKEGRGAPTENPLELDGVRCCLDCEAPIPLTRLELVPNGVRCTECQAKHEERKKAESRRM